MSLAVGSCDDVLWKQMASYQLATADQGIGEAAFKGCPHSGDISIQQGGHEIDLGIVDFTVDQQKVDDADPRRRMSAATSSAIVSKRIGRSEGRRPSVRLQVDADDLATGGQGRDVRAEHLDRAEAAVEQDERLAAAVD
ncbi:MAG: hypothetical protein ACXWPV_05035, partial [Candidatus Limnocylindrales bacterium]